MKVKCFLQIAPQPKCASTALLLLRLVFGIAFIMHGWMKIQSPMAWMPEQAPIHIPAFFQLLAAIAEFGGGIGLVLGLLSNLSSLGIAFTMLVATCVHAFVFGDPFVNSKGGSSFESALMYLAIAILFFVIGPGQFSLDKKIFGERAP